MRQVCRGKGSVVCVYGDVLPPPPHLHGPPWGAEPALGPVVGCQRDLDGVVPQATGPHALGGQHAAAVHGRQGTQARVHRALGHVACHGIATHGLLFAHDSKSRGDNDKAAAYGA